MAPSTRRSSAATRKGSPKGSGRTTAPTHSQRAKSSAQKRAATIAAKKAKEAEVEAEDDAGAQSSEEDKETSENDLSGEDGTDGSSSAVSDISDDTRAELVKLIAARKAAKTRKLSRTGTTTDVVTAAAAKVSVNKDAQKARRNDASVATEKRKKSRVTLGKIIDSLGTGTVARTASPHVSGLPKARKDTSSKKEKRKALSPEQSSGDETDDVIEVPAVPVATVQICKKVDKLISWLALSTLTRLPTPVPAFGRGAAHGSLSLVYTSSLLDMRAKLAFGRRHDYATYLMLLEVVQRYLPQLFSQQPEALPVANLYVCDISSKVKGELDDATMTFDGQQELIDLTFQAFLVDLRADGDAFKPVEAVIKRMAALSNQVAGKKTKTAINAAVSGAQGFPPAFQQRLQQQPQQQQQQQQPSGGGKGSGGTNKGGGKGGGKNGQQRPPPPPGLPGMVWLGSYGAWCRQPYDSNGTYLKHACVRCGAGSIAPNAGHHGTACLATVAEKADWLQNARAVR